MDGDGNAGQLLECLVSIYAQLGITLFGQFVRSFNGFSAFHGEASLFVIKYSRQTEADLCQLSKSKPIKNTGAVQLSQGRRIKTLDTGLPFGPKSEFEGTIEAKRPLLGCQ